MLPEELLRLPEELARVDALLDDPAFFAPFVPFFDPRMGRPSTPMETYLRLMFLKFRYRLGYESLCREVADSITWRRFCRIPLDGAVPHPTALMKLTTRCGSAAVDGLNEALLATAAEAKLLRTNRIRVDTTVVAANVAYPTDSGLLAKATRRIGGAAKLIQAAGGATRTKLRDRSHAAGRRAHEIAAKLRTRLAAGRDEVQATVARVTGQLAELAATAADEAQRLLVNANRALRRARAKAAQLRERGVHDAAAGRRRLALNVPYALLLGVFVAIVDLFPYGSSVGGFVVSVVALTVSIPVAIATLALYIVFRLAEDYLLTPKIIGRAVKVPGGVTVAAVLIGAALLGVIGALVAIPIAAALQLLVQELLFPVLDEA